MDANSEPSPRVSIITLNWNGKQDTLECVDSLKKLNYANYEIVVVDNGSTDGSVGALKSQHPDVAVIENGRNLGYAEGFDAGLEYAHRTGVRYFLILNNDTVVDPDLLSALVRVAESDRRIGFVSGKVYFYDEPNKLQTAGRQDHPLLLVEGHIGSGEIDQGQYDEIKDFDFLDDIFLLVSREAYQDTGGYDPNFFLYYEETDWCARVRRAGYRLVYAPQARVWHKHGKSTGGSKGPLYAFYMARNQIIFMRRNAPADCFGRYLRYLGGNSPRRVAQWIKRRRFDLAAAHLRGVSSGLAWVWRNRKRARSAAISRVGAQ
ncbi:MAG: glycosyltransferase family 2 protein [Chloroflexi bacterium]|nr:glycosyltransferase family 2 protein [Chloroflexota bacterium]